MRLSKGFSGGSAGKESTCNAGGKIHGMGRSPGEGKGYPLSYSGLQNPMDCTVHGVTKSWTRLSDFHFHPTCGHTDGKLQRQAMNPSLLAGCPESTGQFVVSVGFEHFGQDISVAAFIGPQFHINSLQLK